MYYKCHRRLSYPQVAFDFVARVFQQFDQRRFCLFPQPLLLLHLCLELLVHFLQHGVEFLLGVFSEFLLVVESLLHLQDLVAQLADDVFAHLLSLELLVLQFGRNGSHLALNGFLVLFDAFHSLFALFGEVG